MSDVVEVTCPWCHERIELWLDGDERGAFVQDCDVCCRPWRVVVVPPAEPGDLPQVMVDRS
jgi:hypothetical protein